MSFFFLGGDDVEARGAPAERMLGRVGGGIVRRAVARDDRDGAHDRYSGREGV